TKDDIGADGRAALPLNTWSHIATTYDGTTIRLYVNGALVRSRSAAGTIMTTTNPLRIGGNAIRSEWFDGRIDEVRIYNRALSGGEIQTDMNTPIGPPDTTPPTISITAPADGATVSGVVTVSANASDNIAVAGVQFKLDGVDLGAEATASPYSVSW